MASANAATVYVVDDDASIRASIQGLLKSAGLRSEGFETAEKFLERKPLDGPSCLILDVRLPGINGLDFQQQLRTAGFHIPIIFVTAHGDIPMTVKAMKSGAVEFLPKPFGRQQRYGTLTPREREVMSLVILGMLNKQIGSELGTSEVTVKIQRGQVMRKMQAGSVADLVRMSEKLELSVRQ